MRPKHLIFLFAATFGYGLIIWYNRFLCAGIDGLAQSATKGNQTTDSCGASVYPLRMQGSLSQSRMQKSCNPISKEKAITRGRSKKNLQKLPIYWLHVSKSAGTWFCKCGMTVGGRNQGKNFTPQKNCHYLRGDGPLWALRSNPHSAALFQPWASKLPGKTRTCLELEAEIKQLEVDFEGNENFLPMYGAVCDNFRNVILLRNPVQRFLSLMRNHARKCTIHGNTSICVSLFELLLRHVPSANLIASDNFFVRVLGGVGVWSLPYGALNQRHLEHAKQTLQSFDDVLIADAVNPSLAKQMKQRLGWDCGSVISREPRFTLSWPRKVISLLESRNKMDLELYEFGKKLAKFSSEATEYLSPVKNHC